MLKWAGRIAIAVYSILVFIPLILATNRMIEIAGANPFNWFDSLGLYQLSEGAIAFTFVQAIISTIATLLIATPIAWQLGRYSWRGKPLMRAILTMPFVMPAIVAAMGILAFVGPNGFGYRSNESTHFWTLIIAHAWFNMALVIRFPEPVLSTLNRNLEDQLKLLPSGKSALGRFRILWLPLLTPSLAAAACMTFVFSFTSFALVRWLTPLENSLETVMASIGSSAGIEGYSEYSNDLVLASSMIQFSVLLMSLWLMSWLQDKRQSRLPRADEESAQTKNTKGLFILLPGLLFALTPMIIVALASIRIVSRNGVEWSFVAWGKAWNGDYSNTGVWEAMLNSLGYASITLMVALPLGILLALYIRELENSGSKYARIVDLLTLLPFAISSVMIGLGVILGIILIDPVELKEWWILPALPHIMLTTPFVVRIILAALRGLDPAYDENARVLGLSTIERMKKIHFPLMKGPIFIAGIFTMAMSMGEFGASWVVTRFGQWDTLPVLIDQLRSRPGWDPLIQPTAAAAATVLMGITLVLFLIAEKFRTTDQEGMF